MDVVPKVQIAGSGPDGAGSGGVLQALMTLLMAERLDLPLSVQNAPEEPAEPEHEDEAVV